MKNRPIDAVNMGALPDTAPPTSRNAPKRKLTREETAEMIRKARGGDRMEMNKEYSGKVKRYAGGGKVRGDGVCKKGHTKGKTVR